MQISLAKPDDWHLHLRDGAVLRTTVPFSARQFGRAIVMPNLDPPVTNARLAIEYRQRILAAVPPGSNFEPLMTLYLTDHTSAADIALAAADQRIHAVKLYPAGATTHSDSGVTEIRRVDDALAAMSDLDLPLLIHGESTDPTVDVFDREQVFIDRTLTPLTLRFPKLRIVLEHITTAYAVEFVCQAATNVAATITPHHLLQNRNALFQGGLRPHHYCLPVLKRESHRQALLRAATSGNPKFFLGTDSAPHARDRKEAACGCAGIFNSHAALELCATAFEQAGALARLEAFVSFHGADFYRLPRHRNRITLTRESWQVPASYPCAGGELVPLYADETLHWKLMTEPPTGIDTGSTLASGDTAT